jgi:IS30 family transposase
MKQKMTRFLNHENLENQLILLRKNHMINSNLPTKIREEPLNNRPRKRLGYKTPLEVFVKSIKPVALRA